MISSLSELIAVAFEAQSAGMFIKILPAAPRKSVFEDAERLILSGGFPTETSQEAVQLL